MKNDVVHAIGFKRVSSAKQGMAGDSPEDQEDQIRRRAEQLSATLGKSIRFLKFFEFTESASGELDMQPILKTLEYCKISKTKISYAFIKSIDRGTRAGATVYGQLKAQFLRYGVQFVDVYGVIGTQTVNTLDHLGIKYQWSEYSPTWVTELLEAERSKSEVRDILTRLIGASIRYVRMGYRVRPAPPGYVNVKTDTPDGRRVVLEPHPVESLWFIRMFELRIQGNRSDKEIVEELNSMGYRSRRIRIHDHDKATRIIGYKGEKPLNVKQLQRYIQNPVYAGINIEKWTNGQPIREKFPGLVTIEMFNRANKGKITIVEDGDSVRIYRGKLPTWLTHKQKDHPDYPYKKYVLCPTCRNPLYGSASTGEHGGRYLAYHCGRLIDGKRHYYRIPKDKFDLTIHDFVKSIRIRGDFIHDFREEALGEWNRREKHVSDDTIRINKRLIEIEQETHLLKEKIKQLTSTIAIKLIEDDMEKLQQEKIGLMVTRTKKEDEQVDIQIVMNYVSYYLEHFEELLLGSDNPIRNAALFGLLFEETPSYDDVKFGTARLACIFELNEQYNHSKSLSVSRQGFAS